MHDLDQKAKVEVHHDDLDPNHHLVDPVLVQEAEAMTVTEALSFLLTAKVMNARRSTIVLIPRFVMNMESANSRLDLRKMHDHEGRVRVEVEVTVHPDDLGPSPRLVDPVQVPEAGAMTVTEVLNYPLTE